MPLESRHPDVLPAAVFATPGGEIIDHPSLRMMGASGQNLRQPRLDELIPLPPGSELFTLPGRRPLGIDYPTGTLTTLTDNPFTPGEPIQAVAAFMAPAHTAILTAAYRQQQKAPLLPLFAYTAVGWYDGQFWVAAFRSDPDPRQDLDRFDPAILEKQTRKQMARQGDNRLIQHLGTCSLTYGCPAARNYFLGRWEAPLPTSPVCNARCLGCISLQAAGCCPATQDRIDFVPSPTEIAAVATGHLRRVRHGIVSFGQGCEGEPLLQADTLARAISRIRSQTSSGTINLNTNGSLPEAVERLAHAGLDSIRVSLNSARSVMHGRYYRPRNFSLADVRDSITIMKHHRRFVSLNYFILPGFTDDPEEYAALCDLIESCHPDMIQLRNLNMDPLHYLRSLNHSPRQAAMTIPVWLRRLKKRFSWLRFGYFNPALS